MEKMWKSRPVAVALLSVLVMAGCAAESTQSSQFWPGLHVEGLEVDPPQSVEELSEKSDLVVTGTVQEVLRGPVEEMGYTDETPIAQLNIAVDDVVKGEFNGAVLKVIVARQSVVSIDQLAQSIPQEPLTLFLIPTGYQDYYSTSAQIGIIAEGGNGELETVLEPESSDIITHEAPHHEELVELVEEQEKLQQ